MFRAAVVDGDCVCLELQVLMWTVCVFRVAGVDVDIVCLELQVLMGTLLYMKQGLDHSPYSSLLDSVHWLEICDIFTRDACTLLGLSVESPLSVV